MGRRSVVPKKMAMRVPPSSGGNDRRVVVYGGIGGPCGRRYRRVQRARRSRGRRGVRGNRGGRRRITGILLVQAVALLFWHHETLGVHTDPLETNPLNGGFLAFFTSCACGTDKQSEDSHGEADKKGTTATWGGVGFGSGHGYFTGC